MWLLDIIVKSGTSIVEDGAVSLAIKVLDKASNKIEEKNEVRKKKYFENKSESGMLVIIQQKTSWKDKFDIFDENERVKYSVNGELFSVKHSLHIFDDKGNEVARIKEKIISLRKPFSGELEPIDFLIEIGGKKIGKLKSRPAFGKKSYTTDFNDWHVEGNFFGYNYKIYSGSIEIANISKKHMFATDTYVINFPDEKNELLVLILAIAIDAANATRRFRQMRRSLNDTGMSPY